MTEREHNPGISRHEQMSISDILSEEINCIHEKIVTFADKYVLPARLAEALQPENALYFTTGLPETDGANIKNFVTALNILPVVFDEDIQKLDRGEFEPIDPRDNDAGGRLRRNIQLQPPLLFASGWDWKRTLRKSEGMSLYQSGLLAAMIDPLRIANYHVYNKLGRPDSMLAFGDKDFKILTDTSGGGLLLESLVEQRLRELGLTDMSKAKLDTRYELFNAAAQVELMRLHVHDLVDIARLDYGNSILNAENHTMVATMAAKVCELLSKDNLQTKVVYMLDIIEAWKAELGKESSPSKFSTLILKRTEGMVNGLLGQLTTFNLFYEENGFAIPDSLRPLLTRDALFTTEDTEKKRQTQREEIRLREQRRQKEELQEKRTSLSVRHAELSRQIEAATKPWMLPSSRRKALGLADMYRSLRQGFRTPDGEQIIVNIPDDEVPTIIGVLVKLNELAEKSARETDTIDSARAELAANLELQRALEAQRHEFYEAARVIKSLELPPLDMLPLQTSIERLRAEWPAFEKLMNAKWPKDGAVVAERIKKLLE